jgi:hypothetical protein
LLAPADAIGGFLFDCPIPFHPIKSARLADFADLVSWRFAETLVQMARCDE